MFIDLVKNGLAGGFKAAKINNDHLLEVHNLLFIENNPAGLKAFLFEMGLIKNEFHLALVSSCERIQQAIHNFINR